MKKMRIYAANSVFIEVTRRCNMCCAHCLRGDAESIDIQEKYIDAFLDSFEKEAYISSLTFTGGEISLNIPAIRYTLKAVKERGIAVGSFYMVTNGKAVDKMADLAMASLEWWNYCDDKDDYSCGLCISSDDFHEAIPYESKSILSGLKYNRNDKVTDFHRACLLNEGRAKNLDSNIYKKREPCVDKLEYEFSKTGGIDFYSGELYLNAIGDVVSGCDLSYESQKKYRFGNEFFRIPDTKILRVPLPMLQLTRLGFETLNPVTKEIVNRYCKRIFKLDEHEDYFIKTGTYSSKYEFRNAHIHDPKEINEMGEYFLFLNHLTCSMASPLNNTCFYGANTTNEWVLREYIKDKEHNPTIYNGLPLHTEYRVFVDFDADEVLGISPYWRADVMKGKFKNASTPQERHDYVIYQMHEDILQSRYDDSARMILEEIKKILPAVELVGQWSIDVMRNGDDYYIIDMALAENSALNDCVPREKLRPYPQQWLPMAANS